MNTMRLILKKKTICWCGINTSSSQTQAFGGHGYTHILNNVVPMMLSRGVTKEQIDTILVDNPKAWLSF